MGTMGTHGAQWKPVGTSGGGEGWVPSRSCGVKVVPTLRGNPFNNT
jgi:hypothetical protein